MDRLFTTLIFRFCPWDISRGVARGSMLNKAMPSRDFVFGDNYVELSVCQSTATPFFPFGLVVPVSDNSTRLLDGMPCAAT